MNPKIGMFDLETQQVQIYKNINNRIKKVLSHGQYIKGPEVSELESKLAEYTGVKHCLTCGNGTDAIMISLMALKIMPEDEILVPSFTYAASAEPISLLGAKPVFVEVDNQTFNFDFQHAKKKLTSKTKGIIATSLYGQCADFHSINKFAKEHGLFVLEDGAQSFGAQIGDKKSCSFTDIATTSFFPTKPLGCYGDGGAIFTNNDDLALLVSQIRAHGQSKKYEHIRLGVNSRLDSIQAAILLEKLLIFPGEVELRNEVADQYNNLITTDLIEKPKIKDGFRSVYALYTIKTKLRDTIKNELKKVGVSTGIYYQIPLHKQLAFSNYPCEDLQGTEELCHNVLSLPMHPYLELSAQEEISKMLNNVS